MAKRSRIRVTRIQPKVKGIKPTQVRDIEKVSFNLKNLREKKTKKKFEYAKCKVNYFLTLIDRFRAVCNMTRKDMWRNRLPLKHHPIDFKKDKGITEKSFDLGQDVDDDAWQFSLTANEHGRVHGYFVGNVFYVVWLDPDHQLYCK